MDKDEQKRAIYERLSPRRKKYIDRIGYEKWDPFQEPNHPIEIRRDRTKRTARDLFLDFLNEHPSSKDNLAYRRGAQELCMGIFSSDDRCRGMFDFCLWYLEQLKRRDVDPAQIWER